MSKAYPNRLNQGFGLPPRTGFTNFECANCFRAFISFDLVNYLRSKLSLES